jgi:hypothetical protein
MIKKYFSIIKLQIFRLKFVKFELYILYSHNFLANGGQDKSQLVLPALATIDGFISL